MKATILQCRLCGRKYPYCFCGNCAYTPYRYENTMGPDTVHELLNKSISDKQVSSKKMPGKEIFKLMPAKEARKSVNEYKEKQKENLKQTITARINQAIYVGASSVQVEIYGEFQKSILSWLDKLGYTVEEVYDTGTQYHIKW